MIQDRHSTQVIQKDYDVDYADGGVNPGGFEWDDKELKDTGNKLSSGLLKGWKVKMKMVVVKLNHDIHYVVNSHFFR